jgi:hypothetical protein
VSGKEREKGNKVGQDGTEWETSVRGREEERKWEM